MCCAALALALAGPIAGEEQKTSGLLLQGQEAEAVWKSIDIHTPGHNVRMLHQLTYQARAAGWWRKM